MPVKPGDILHDKFRIDALIGRGGMGQVFAATDLDSRQQVAIKVVSRLFVDETLMLRLHREAVAAQRIRSDYVPRVFEVNDTGEGETYLVMERLMGEPLSARIRSQGALPWPEVSKLGEEILRGLIDAHSAGIIHRDLKPSNVFLALKTGKVRAMVLDFGVCKMDGLDTERLTGTGESIGTVAYMAPEQIRGAAKVDERADIYAFGVVVFEMLTGRLPHEGPSQMAILASKLEKSAARLRDCVRYEIPSSLDDLVMQCLERDLRGRQANVQEVLRQWRVLARAEGFISGPSMPPPPNNSSKPAPLPGAPHEDDHPTEISKPSAVPAGLKSQVDMLLAGTSSDDESLPRTNDAPAELNLMFAHGAAPPMSDAPMTTTGGGPSAVKTGARYALFGASAGVLVLLCLFAFKLSRPEPTKRVSATPPPVTSAPAATTPDPLTTTTAPEPTALSEPTNDPPPAQTITSNDSIELPASRSPASAPRPVSRPISHPRPAPAPAPVAPKASTPRITSEPRY